MAVDSIPLGSYLRPCSTRSRWEAVMVNRRTFLPGAMSAILVQPSCTDALQRASLPTIGVLYPTPDARTPITEAFETELRNSAS